MAALAPLFAPKFAAGAEAHLSASGCGEVRTGIDANLAARRNRDVATGRRTLIRRHIDGLIGADIKRLVRNDVRR